MIRRLLEFFFVVISFTWGRWFAEDGLQPELYGICIGTSMVLIVDLILFFHAEKSFLRLYLNSVHPWANPEVRLTISYLYKIECNGRYLLVKSNRLENTFQPVGGVYKYFWPEAKKDLEQIGAIPDNNICNDKVSQHDLRLKLLKRSNLRKFLKWFLSYKERELDPWREFYEELVATGILPTDKFGFIYYEIVGQHFEPLHYDEFFKIDTFKYADIYSPRFTNSDQLKELEKLQDVQHPNYLWVTQEEIKNGKTRQGKIIADHTHKIFHTKKINK